MYLQMPSKPAWMQPTTLAKL